MFAKQRVAVAAATVDLGRSNGFDVTRGFWHVQLLGLQLLGLWTVSVAGSWAVRMLGLPIPGNLAGIVILYTLLSVGAVKVAWLDAAGSLLVKHLAFFFIPIAAGVMDAGRLLAEHGLALALTLIASAAIGIGLSGVIAQRLSAQSQPGDVS